MSTKMMTMRRVLLLMATQWHGAVSHRRGGGWRWRRSANSVACWRARESAVRAAPAATDSVGARTMLNTDRLLRMLTLLLMLVRLWRLRSSMRATDWRRRAPVTREARRLRVGPEERLRTARRAGERVRARRVSRWHSAACGERSQGQRASS